MVQNFTIREAAEEDLPGILECLREAFEPYREAYTPAAFADTVPETLAGRLQTMTVLVAAADDGTIAGTVSFGLAGEREGHLRGMAVREAWQGCGIAPQLLASAEARLRALGCRRATLDTTQPLTRAIAFYRRNGYAPTSRVQDFFGMPLYEFARDLGE